MLKFSPFFLFLLILLGCNPNKKTNQSTSSGTAVTEVQSSPFLLDFSPEGKVAIGQKITIKLRSKDSTRFDSLKLKVNDLELERFTSLPKTIEWNSGSGRLGQNTVKVFAYIKGKEMTDQFAVRLVSDVAPKILNYKLVKVYPHDKNAYTQGLFFYNNFLHEATGLEGQSSLRKVKLETGDVVKSYQLPNNVFGEGITLYKDWIVQITWQSHVGYVYDKETFNLIKKFEYPTEGWGIVAVGDQLVMSDGTENLYFLDPNNFSEVKRIQVYDSEGPVDNINEMEYIDGAIYANIYRTDKIAQIDPATGKVLAYINLKNLLPESDKYDGIDVLNGIAYDKKTNRLFVTGKKWPKLFEIKIN